MGTTLHQLRGYLAQITDLWPQIECIPPLKRFRRARCGLFHSGEGTSPAVLTYQPFNADVSVMVNDRRRLEQVVKIFLRMRVSSSEPTKDPNVENVKAAARK